MQRLKEKKNIYIYIYIYILRRRVGHKNKNVKFKLRATYIEIITGSFGILTIRNYPKI